MAGKYGSASVSVTLEDGPGGTARDITNHILSMGGIKITSAMQRSDALGDSWEEHTPTGKRKLEPLTLEGFWDTTATTGPHVVLQAPDDGPQDDGRELVVIFGDSKTMTVDVRLVDYEVLATNSELTKFRSQLLPTGAATWS